MSNDRDDFDHEESEYHFTDDDMGYDVEPEIEKTATASASIAKENILTRLTSSKRMLISIGVFLVLVFVVYKVVTPTATTAPSTDIAAVQPTQQGMPATASTIVANNPAQQANMPQSMPVASPVQTMQTAPVQTVASQPMTQPAANNGLPPQSSVVPLPPQSTVVSQSQPTYQQPSMPAPQTASAMPVQNISIDGSQQVAQPTNTDLNVRTDQAMAQMQAEYQQKLNDYSMQNKAILDQLQSLAAKVATIENQMNAMTQNIARPNPLTSSMGPSSNAASSAPALPDDQVQRVAYNVQAIIPGRAWLKSDNGETVTVAEGDVVRDLGRISKIDPYDGIVEINTGRKMITLSYGNVG